MIFLIDCNNFYVSCERLFNPSLNKKPVMVLSSNDGCVIARSQEVKDLGIPMGMAYFKIKDFAKRNNIIIFSSNFPLYADISSRVMNVLKDFDSELEVYSIDEAFLKFEFSDPIKYLELAQEIKNRVKKWLGIPISIGIGATKTLAKVANKKAKKLDSGIYIFPLQEEKADELLSKIPVGDIWGIGYGYSKTLIDYNIKTALDLKYSKDAFIKKKLTVCGLRTVWELRGMPCISEFNQDAKSISYSRTFGQRVTSFLQLKEAILNYTAQVAQELRQNKQAANILTLYITTGSHGEFHYSNYESVVFSSSTLYSPDLFKYALQALDSIYKAGFAYKKAMVMVSGLVQQSSMQISLFDSLKPAIDSKAKQMKVLDSINNKWGKNTVLYAGMGLNAKWKMRQFKKTPHYTTLWQDIPVVK